ncbi:hypothetical protein SC09_Contig19orf00587 [Bacillus subtilis]|uniref:Uncharacterized protein n=1 Tax=Bacillus subtilis TaxID=1423 RepID=A0A0D1L1E9_BACIU|nr:hypothetical protein SC09_Contig19orf00587 [Bacillus subtilis]
MQINGIMRKTSCFINHYMWKTKKGGEIDGKRDTNILLSG